MSSIKMKTADGVTLAFDAKPPKIAYSVGGTKLYPELDKTVLTTDARGRRRTLQLVQYYSSASAAVEAAKKERTQVYKEDMERLDKLL